MSARKYGVKNFLHIANELLNPNTDTLDGIQKYLETWFCFKYDTTPNDARLQEMTLEELMILYQMHRIKEDPNYYAEQTNPQTESYEEWLQREMGSEYASEEENIKQIEEADKEFTKKVRERFPDKITTDFAQFQKKD